MPHEMKTPNALPTRRPDSGTFRTWLIAAAAFLCATVVGPLRAFTLPPGFSEQAIGSGWVEPVGVAFDPSPDAANRVYVWERAGRVWIVENGVRLATPLIDISDEVGAWRDFGMLGVALHPNFHENGLIFLSYVVDRHHLLNAGTPAYDPTANDYFAATIGRIVRYTARATDGFRSVDPASRKVLVGETKTTGFPIVNLSHGVGHLVFGSDGTLLASCGESASFDEVDDGSNPSLTYAPQALADGIISAKENVGSFRAQLIDSLSGKVVRIDPETGDGVPGNPFFDSENPRAPRSRVWALGFRNPFRFTIRPETGSHHAADADPGVIVLGDVGWAAFEEIDVIVGPGKNCGWPLFEGLTSHESFRVVPLANPDAPNPIGGFFKFRDLLIQETLATPSWPNPLDPAQQVPATIPHFMHTRPVIDIGRLTSPDGPARAATFFDTTAGEILIGDPTAPVAGPQFGANASVGGTFYTGTDFPESYRGTYFHADFGHGWIKSIAFDANHRPTQVSDFASGGAPVFLATHPTLGALYAVDLESASVLKIAYAPGGNLAPAAAASASVAIGTSPLSVDFSSAGSHDPDDLPLAYLWDFGDGTTSAEAAPTHVFTATGPRRFDVTLTVTDAGGATAQAGVSIFANDTLPEVTLLSPVDGAKYSLAGDTEYALTRLVTEAPGHPTVTRWNVFLHHNEHQHGEPAVIGPEAVALISPIHSLTETYFFRVQLTVTDDLGAQVIREARLYPNAANIAPQTAWSLARQPITASWSPQILDAAATITDADSPGIEFGKLRVALSVAREGDALTILPGGPVNLRGGSVAFGGVLVGTMSGGSNGAPLEVIFNEAATPAAAQAILRRVAGAFGTAGTRVATATIDDGDGGICGTGSLSIEVAAPPNQPPTVALRKPGNGSSYFAPAAITLLADAGDADGRVVKVEFFCDGTRLAKMSAPPFRFVWSGVSPGIHSLTARATDDRGVSATSAAASVTIVGPDPLPPAWSAQDIGNARGRAGNADGKFTLRAAGAGLGATSDEIHFAWQPWSGDGEIIARVNSIRNVTPQSFGALTFRESLLPNARHVSLTLNAATRARLKWRDGIAPALQQIKGSILPTPGWLKLTRRGSRFTGSVSGDGIAWTVIGTTTVPLPDQCLVGLAASAASATARTAVIFSNVTGPRLPAP